MLLIINYFKKKLECNFRTMVQADMFIYLAESHASAVSLLESGEQRYIKAIIIPLNMQVLDSVEITDVSNVLLIKAGGHKQWC